MRKVSFNTGWKCARKGTDDYIDVTVPHDAMLLDERIEMGKRIKKSFGEDIGNRVFESIAASTTADVISGTAKVDASTGVLSKTGTINIKSNHHYHAKISEE